MIEEIGEKIAMTVIMAAFLLTGATFGIIYSDYQYELKKQANIQKVIMFMDCLQKKGSCK